MRAFGRSLSDFGVLHPAERTLLENCADGVVTCAESKKPAVYKKRNHVRASFLRFLLLGGDRHVAIHERGIQIKFAYISGVLDLEFASVIHGFYAESCVFEKRINCTRADFKHEVCLLRSSIKGFVGDGICVAGDFDMEDAESIGKISLKGSTINGSLKFSGASIDGRGGEALLADDSDVRGDVLLNDGFSAKGRVSLFCAKITGQLNGCSGRFSSVEKAIAADGVQVGSGIFLCDGFKSKGQLSFIGATVEGQMSLRGARLKASGDQALVADRICINGSLFLDMGFKAKGQICLRGARISAQLAFNGARITGRQSNSISADRIHVKGSVSMGRGFFSKGYVRFVSARIDGSFSMREAAQLRGLVADQMQVNGSMTLCSLTKPLSRVSLAGARVTALNDDAKSWGKYLKLNGFVYDLLDVHNTMSVEERVEWLEKQCSQVPEKGVKPQVKSKVFVPQPWQQLKAVLENMGRAEDSREIGIEYERHRAKCGQIGLSPTTWGRLRRGLNSGIAKTLHFFYGKLIGYGYRPMQLVPWFLGVWLLTTVLYWYAANQGAVFAPSDPLIFQNEAYMTCQPSSDETFKPAPGTGNWYLCNALPQEYTGFSPIAFSLDLLLPLVDLHQEKDWAPLIETPKANIGEEMLGILTLKRFVRFIMWFEILAGWVFSLLFVVIVSGLARRKEQ